MSLAQEIGWGFSRVEVVNLNGLLLGNGEHLSSVTELDFSTVLDLERLEGMELLGEHVEEHDLVSDGNDDVEATWVECNGKCVFVEGMGDFESLLVIVPKLEGSII